MYYARIILAKTFVTPACLQAGATPYTPNPEIHYSNNQ